MKRIIPFIFFGFLGYSQTKEDIKKIVTANDNRALIELNKEYEAESIKREQRVNDYLQKNPQQKRWINVGEVTKELFDVNSRNEVFYISTYNKNSATTSRVDRLYSGGILGLNLQGQGMLVGVWDAGSARATHNQFQGRVSIIDGAPTHNHATHVTGTVVAGGVNNPLVRGMAFEANVNSYNWTNDITEMSAAALNGLLVSNHSYGPDPATSPMWLYGAYDSQARSYDQLLFASPYLLSVKAAGNDRDNYSTLNPSKNGYDLIAGSSTAKNFLCVGAVNQVLNYTSSTSVIMSSFSSWGPTDDGRIKPDVVTQGVGVRSTTSATDFSTGLMDGTSMASPGVAGLAILLQQHHNNLYANYLKSASLKGLIMHTADEAGLFAGPDYRFGWGLVNAEKAAIAITEKNVGSVIDELTLQNNQIYTTQVTANGAGPLFVSISWTDRGPTQVNNGTVDSSLQFLVNDLDVRVQKNGQTFFPWTLNPVTPTFPAVNNSDNSVDNFEKIEVENASGTYTVTVSHKGSLVGLSQDFSLIITGADLQLNTDEFGLIKNDIKIFPNPTNNILNFNIGNLSEIDNISIIDISGKVITPKFDLNSKTIDVSNLQSGVYFVRFDSEGQSLTKKFIKI